MKLLLPCLLLLFTLTSLAQSKPRFPDGRTTAICAECVETLQSRPKEVLYGISIADGDVYFTISNKEWLGRLIKEDDDAISADLVAKDQYACGKPSPGVNGYAKGIFLDPVYRPALMAKIVDMGEGVVSIPIGKVPSQLKGKELEGNLVILHKGQVCMYTFFTDIPRTQWDILPMGLYVDSVVNYMSYPEGDAIQTPLLYTKELQFTVPFGKGKATLPRAGLQPLYDSLKWKDYNIQRIDIRAFSSVEGPAGFNATLQRQRAKAVVIGLQQFLHAGVDTHISYGDDWVELRRDIASSGFKDLSGLTDDEIRSRLANKGLKEKLEPLLKGHRKAIITLWLAPAGKYTDLRHPDLVTRFNNAVAKKEIPAAIALQRDLFEQVAAGKAPNDYLDQLEIPKEKTYDVLLSNREVYNLLLNRYDGKVAIQNLNDILRLSPDNGKVKYNICALSLQLWRVDSGFVQPPVLLKDINDLSGMSIPSSLIRRMLINYHIALSEVDMARYNYAGKDSSLAYIKNNYQDIHLKDEDLLALAKYLCFYQQCEWSENLLRPRVTKIDVDEDLLFYYVNLKLTVLGPDLDDVTRQVINNAITINPKRFCRYFDPIGKGGVTFQLLDYPELKSIYCNTCNIKSR